jgi:plasmid stability protein
MRTHGRPKKVDPVRLRRPTAVRLRDELRDKLAACAASQGRSLSEEIEARLERSLIADEVREAVAAALSVHQ